MQFLVVPEHDALTALKLLKALLHLGANLLNPDAFDDLILGKSSQGLVDDILLGLAATSLDTASDKLLLLRL